MSANLFARRPVRPGRYVLIRSSERLRNHVPQAVFGDDVESAKGQPIEKSVKKDGEEISNRTVVDLKEPKEDPQEPLFEPYEIGDNVVKEEVEDEEIPGQFDVNNFGFPNDGDASSPAGDIDGSMEEAVIDKKEKKGRKKIVHPQIKEKSPELIGRTRTRNVFKPVKFGEYGVNSDRSVRPKPEKKRKIDSAENEDEISHIATVTPKPTLRGRGAGKKKEELKENRLSSNELDIINQERAAAAAAVKKAEDSAASAAELELKLHKELNERREETKRNNEKLETTQLLLEASQNKAVKAEERCTELELEIQNERKERSEEREKDKEMIASFKQQFDHQRATAAAAVKKVEDAAARATALEFELQKERNEKSKRMEKGKMFMTTLNHQRDQDRATAVAAEEKAAESAAKAVDLERQLQKEREERREERKKDKEMLESTQLQLESYQKKAADAEGRAAALELDLQKERNQRSKRVGKGVMIISTLTQESDQYRLAAATAEEKAAESAARAAELELELQKERNERSEIMEKGKIVMATLNHQRDLDRATAAAAEKKAAESAAKAADLDRELQRERDERMKEKGKMEEQLHSIFKTFADYTKMVKILNAEINGELQTEIQDRKDEMKKGKEKLSAIEKELQKERNERREEREEVKEKVEEERRGASNDRKRALEERMRDHVRIAQLTAQIDELKQHQRDRKSKNTPTESPRRNERKMMTTSDEEETTSDEEETTSDEEETSSDDDDETAQNTTKKETKLTDKKKKSD